MLWWLMGQRSETLNCPFSEVAPDALPFILARELDELTTRVPGPRSAVALISQAGLRAKKKLSIESCIGAVPNACEKAVVAEQELSPGTAPQHSGLQSRIETAH